MRCVDVPIRCGEYGKCRMTIYLPAFLDDCTLAQRTKLFKLIMKSQSQDEEAIHIFNEYIPEMLEEKKDIWAQKSRKFQNEYKDPSYPYYTDLDGRTQKYSKKELISIRAKNKRMTQAVLTAKRNYESFQKYDALWNEIKEKYQ